jgi:iron complex transport system ATP-binding protein
MNAALRASELRVPGRLSAISLELPKASLTAVVGPNGAGKSTLMQALAGLLEAEGEIQWEGRPLRRIGFLERGRMLAWVGQESQADFAFAVGDVVAQGRYAWRDDGVEVAAALKALDLTRLASRPVTQLSGGERRRVFLARALATGAPIQLWDEPTSNLDVRHGLEVTALARSLARQGSMVLLSLHDIRAAYRFDRVLVLHQGELVADGPPHEVLTAALLRAVFRVEARFVESLVPELPETEDASCS